MGIIYRQAKMLLDAHHAGLPMKRLLTIGHQALFLHPSELRKLQKLCPGAPEVHSMDYSAYEGATLLHDLNEPIPEALKGRYDAVVEAGSLEHIFNFPVAVANLMQMTRVGGTIFMSTIANNLCGHGFYQFSPELIFRVFSRDNGFDLGPVFALKARYPGVELIPIFHAFEVPDPAILGYRIGLMTKHPVLLCFEARKTAALPLFAHAPIQSDYVAAWLATEQQPQPKPPQWIEQLPLYWPFCRWRQRSRLLHSIRNQFMGRRQVKDFSLNNTTVFKKVG
jgi:hypothetical protein